MADAMTSDSASRVTRSRRSLALAAALFAGGIVAVGALSAQQTQDTAQAPQAAPAGPAATPATGGSTAAPVAAGKPAAPAASQPKPAEPTTPPAAGANRGTAAGPAQEHFEPTEKVRADFDVSFPVDI
jgi:hypothetical protein